MATKQRARGKRNTERHDGPRLRDNVLALARTLLRDRMVSSVRTILDLSEAVRDSTRALPDMPNLGAYAIAAADSLDDIADYVSDSDVDSVLRDASIFARQHPVLTVAISATAAIAAVNHFRSEAMRRPLAVPRGKRASIHTRPVSAASIRKATNGHTRAIHA